MAWKGKKLRQGKFPWGTANRGETKKGGFAFRRPLLQGAILGGIRQTKTRKSWKSRKGNGVKADDRPHRRLPGQGREDSNLS